MPGQLSLEVMYHQGLLTGEALCHIVLAISVTSVEGCSAPLLLHAHLACPLMLMPCAKQFRCCSAGPQERLPTGQPEVPPGRQPEPQAVLQGAAAKLQQQLMQGQLDKLSPAGRMAGPGGAADRAAAAVHFGSDGEAGMPTKRTAAPGRQLRGLASLTSIIKRGPRAGRAHPSHMGNPQPGQQPSQLQEDGSPNRLAAGLEAAILSDQSGSIEEEPVQLAASAAAVAAFPAASGPHAEAWTLGRMTAPRRLPPLTHPMQGTAGPTTHLSGDWVSCLCTACTGSCPLAPKLGRWVVPVCRWLSQQPESRSL